MQDRPTYRELLEAVRHFIEEDAVPALEGPKKFHARVAANVLAIVQRELECEEAQLHGEWGRLDAVLGASRPLPADRTALRSRVRERTAELCARIQRGDADADPWRAAVVAHVRQTVIDKLTVANPKYVEADRRAGVVTPDDPKR